MRRYQSIRQQLLWATAIGIVVASMVSAAITNVVNQHQLNITFEAQGHQAAAQLGAFSELALLYQSPENASEAINYSLSLPGVDYVALFDKDGRLLVDRGNTGLVAQAPTLHDLEPLVSKMRGEHTAFSTEITYHAEGEESPIFAEVPEPELIGYAYVLLDRSDQEAASRRVFRNSVMIGILIAVVLLLLMRLRLNQVLLPLAQLSKAMRNIANGRVDEVKVHANSAEVAQITEAFDVMQRALADRDQRLQDYAKNLEAQVQLRTVELVQARDHALSSSRQKSEFLSNISHELRTPLQSIIGYSDTLLEDLEDEGLDDYASDVNKVMSSAEHLLSLINDLLDYTKADAGQLALRPQHFALTDLLKELDSMIKPLMTNNGNHFMMKIEIEVDGLYLDRGKVMQVLLNLLSNAAKFTQMGHVSLSMSCGQHSLDVSIQDSGIGMETSHQTMIFEPFRQVDGSFTRSFQGTGLGLSISRQIIEMMGGKIGLESTLGQGSRFFFSIPLDSQE